MKSSRTILTLKEVIKIHNYNCIFLNNIKLKIKYQVFSKTRRFKSIQATYEISLQNR